MITKPDFNLLQDLLKDYTPEQRGFATKAEVELIANRLELETRTEVELRNMRNFSVLFLGKQASSAHEREAEGKPSEKSFDTLMDMMSAITAVIDGYILKAGGEV